MSLILQLLPTATQITKDTRMFPLATDAHKANNFKQLWVKELHFNTEMLGGYAIGYEATVGCECFLNFGINTYNHLIAVRLKDDNSSKEIKLFTYETKYGFTGSSNIKNAYKVILTKTLSSIIENVNWHKIIYSTEKMEAHEDKPTPIVKKIQTIQIEDLDDMSEKKKKYNYDSTFLVDIRKKEGKGDPVAHIGTPVTCTNGDDSLKIIRKDNQVIFVKFDNFYIHRIYIKVSHFKSYREVFRDTESSQNSAIDAIQYRLEKNDSIYTNKEDAKKDAESNNTKYDGKYGLYDVDNYYTQDSWYKKYNVVARYDEGPLFIEKIP